MRISALAMALWLVLAVPARGQKPGVLPMMSSVEPGSARVGTLVTAVGANLGRETVAAIFLTDGSIDIKLEIVEQTATVLKFKVPPAAKPGRYALMVLTNGAEPKYIEEPVKITIEPETTARAARSEYVRHTR